MPNPQASMRKIIFSRKALVGILNRKRRAGARVVFTNGCFDLLHVGHIALLARARRQGDLLVVGINSDASVRKLKGAGRPITPAKDRAVLLAALSAVDYVTLFAEPTPLSLIRALRPKVLIKGADWGSDAIVGRSVIEEYGGRVVRLPLSKGYSTSAIIRRIKTGH